MKRQHIFLVLLLGVQVYCKGQPSKINGVSFVAARDAITQQHVAPVLRIYSNYVALMPYSFIRTASTPKVEFNNKEAWFGETEKGLLQYAKAFKKADIKIMVKPHLWIGRGVFTGALKPTTETQWKLLESSYRAYIHHLCKSSRTTRSRAVLYGYRIKAICFT